MNHGDIEQIHHVARLAFLAMSARAVAATEFDTTPEVAEVRVVVRRGPPGEQLSLDLEFIGSSGFPLGGMSV